MLAHKIAQILTNYMSKVEMEVCSFIPESNGKCHSSQHVPYQQAPGRASWPSSKSPSSHWRIFVSALESSEACMWAGPQDQGAARLSTAEVFPFYCQPAGQGLPGSQVLGLVTAGDHPHSHRLADSTRLAVRLVHKGHLSCSL